MGVDLMSYTDIDKIRDLCDELKENISNNPNIRQSYEIWKQMEEPIKNLIKKFDKIKDDGDGKMVDDQEVIKMTNEYAREIAYAKAIRKAKKLGIPYPSRLDLEDLLKEIEHQKSLRKG